MNTEALETSAGRSSRCYMATVPGHHAQYEGWVLVVSPSDDPADLHRAAVAQLRRTAFPDYSGLMWRLVKHQPSSAPFEDEDEA